ncbi:MAG: beta-N-acetylhexosaminidase [Bdellovibrionaceae bacterium]|nr:beta-N-acetylhexosaminidase [Pseudobdellovibrionaceae bacterium]
MLGSCLMIALKGTALLKKEREFILRNQPAGVILFKRNIESLKQVFKLNQKIKALIKPSPLIAIDMEGGRVNRLSDLKGFKAWPSAKELGKKTPQEIFLTAKKQAHQLKELGFDINFAPVVDLPLVDSLILKTRTFGKKASSILRAGEAFLKGFQEEGLISCLKHFPGHGGVFEDSHESLPVDKRSLGELSAQLSIFQKLFKKYPSCIMTAHIEFPEIEKIPATFSKTFLTQILRKRLGFQGLIVSDDIDMKALKTFSPGETCFFALKAGCDMILSCQGLDKPLKAIRYFERQIQKKEELKKELKRARKNILKLKKQL